MGKVQTRDARSSWKRCAWAGTVALLVSCGEEYEQRAAPITRRLGGDSMKPGALIKVCDPDHETCVPTYALKCSMRWAGDPAQKPDFPQLSPDERAWCEQHAPTDIEGHQGH